MYKKFRLFVFHRNPSEPCTYVGQLDRTIDMESTNPLDTIATHVRHYIKSLQEFHSFGEDADGIDFVVHQVRK